MKHTPGPWYVYKQSVRGDDGNIVALTESDYRTPEQEDANARLIAAAPELLQVCKDELEAIRVWLSANPTPNADVVDGMFISIQKLKAVITRAEG